MRRSKYLPEGCAPLFPKYQPLSVIIEAMEHQSILQGTAVRCDGQRNLFVRFGGYEGYIPRQEAVHPAISGSERDISVLSTIGKEISFTVSAISTDGAGKPHIILSRRAAQEQALAWLMEHAPAGTVLPARVTHLAAFGAFVDLGCGVISLVPLENLSFSRISHPSDRLTVGQDILVLVTDVDRERKRFSLSHKELLGTWLENAADFVPGDTVTGTVRGIQDYGVFVELTPNLSGLADWKSGLQPGDSVSVFIKSIRPENRKIKLQIIQKLDSANMPQPLRYFITDGPVSAWTY